MIFVVEQPSIQSHPGKQGSRGDQLIRCVNRLPREILDAWESGKPHTDVMTLYKIAQLKTRDEMKASWDAQKGGGQ